jgi:hypothetical protein
MHAIIRRYEATDKMRTTEIVKKAQDSLLPRMSEMPSFSGYYLIEAGNGVFSSVSVFDTEAHAGESTRVASTWVREENLQTALTNPPKITSGKDKPMIVAVGQREHAIQARRRHRSQRSRLLLPGKAKRTSRWFGFHQRPQRRPVTGRRCCSVRRRFERLPGTGSTGQSSGSPPPPVGAWQGPPPRPTRAATGRSTARRVASAC